MLVNGLLLSVILLFFSGVPALISGRGAVVGERLAAALLIAGALLGLGVTSASLCSSPLSASIFWEMPDGRLLLGLDAISAVFLLPAFLILGLGGIYGLGYWPQARHGSSAGVLRLIYGILGASIVLLPISRNSILFLVVWEVMALCGFLLIITERQKEEARRAAYLYLFATHTATLALFAFFILLARENGSFVFPAIAVLNGASPVAQALFLLALFGFGVKAGLMPFHIWLPSAHAAAPSHVSALMSGVMIKIGIYGLVRSMSFFYAIPAWWGWLILLLGVVSGIMGVVYALAQHDVKRLLAYHSVENIGIILIGLGIAMLGASTGNATLVTLGLAGALLHVINHGLFKALLFLSAGAVIQATGTRHIDALGGLLPRMQWTALFFLGGAVAICGLPPLNGFVSEWLVYLGLLSAAGATDPDVALAVLAAPALAMIGALAVACFVKVFGVVFLGTPRSEAAIQAGEVGPTMLLPMVVLLFTCLLIGTLPGLTLPLLKQAVKDFSPLATGADLNRLAPAGAAGPRSPAGPPPPGSPCWPTPGGCPPPKRTARRASRPPPLCR